MFDEPLKKVWKKGKVVHGYESDYVRKDACGAWMSFEDYNNRESQYCRGIDHVYSKSKLKALGVRYFD